MPQKTPLGERRAFTVGQKRASPVSAVDKLFVRLFNTDDGKAVLKILANETAGTVVPVDAPTAALQRMEGKRELVADIIERVERGIKG